jgi:CubicO group peptidase (beta-lactamase class C family)
VTRKFLFILLAGLSFTACQPAARQTTSHQLSTSTYYPGKDNWKQATPAQVGMNADLLNQAVAWARTQETTQMKPDFSTQELIFGKLLGPMPASRSQTNGIILRHGYIVAEWGDTRRPDPTYSVAKSVLSTLLGITLDRGMIKSIQDPVAAYIHDGGYDTPQNRQVTWEHHARQTSEWEGEMFGKKHDFVGKEAFGQGERKPRALQTPGSYYEYNDVRINRLALSLLRLWRQPLPQVFREQVMAPIGASDTWQYVPYANATVQVDGKPMPSVSGGTRWGGGLWINTRDEARFGYLMLRQGRWENRQIVSANWVQQATTRGPAGPDYGYLWWLNTGGKAWPDAPVNSFAALGAGSNTIWVDPSHDLVIVWRWHNGSPNELIKRVLAAVQE